MSTNGNRAAFWSDAVWASIDQGVTDSLGAIRVAQKVFDTETLANTTSVPADEFDPDTMTIVEGVTKPFVELALEFQLTNGQVNEDPTGATATTLATLAARSLALGEDSIILVGKSADLHGAKAESGRASTAEGLLGLAARRQITVNPPDAGAPTNSGGNILAAIAAGIAMLTKDAQAPPWGLIEDTSAFAATWGSVINGAPAYTVLENVLTGGIYGTGAMPANTGLLVALGGKPTTIYMSGEATTEPTQQERGGVYSFRTFERVQYVARDQRAFVHLDFAYLARAGKAQTAKAQGQP